MENTFICRILQEDDKEAVRELIESTFSEFLRGKYWNWKYAQNPYFDSSLVTVAEEKGEIVGCNHWLLRPFKLSSAMVVDAILAGDIAVKPEHRRKGVGKALMRFQRSSELTKNKQAALIYMFAETNLSKSFHTPVGGYIPVRDKTVSYMKILNWRMLEEKATGLKEKMKIEKTNLHILLKIRHAPSLNLLINKDGVKINGISSESKADVTITADLVTLRKLRRKEKRKWSLFKAFLTGKLKISGKPRKIFSFYKNLWVLEELFSGRIA
jgi:predicted N-acetyltransferase YhbS/putative sterol carrier protein